MKTIAIILAAGAGTRMNIKQPKQFLLLKNKAIICYSIEAFEMNNFVDEVVLVVSKGFIELSKKIIIKNSYQKIKDVIVGGKTRHESSYIAIKHIASKEKYAKLLLHDSARPFISQTIIQNVILHLNTNNAVCPYMPLTDTIYKLTAKQTVERIPKRKSFCAVQTPQGFMLKTIKNAYEIGLRDENFNPTDDGSVVYRYLPNTTIKMIKGEKCNRKITYVEDIKIVDK